MSHSILKTFLFSFEQIYDYDLITQMNAYGNKAYRVMSCYLWEHFE